MYDFWIMENEKGYYNKSIAFPELVKKWTLAFGYELNYEFLIKNINLSLFPMTCIFFWNTSAVISTFSMWNRILYAL